MHFSTSALASIAAIFATANGASLTRVSGWGANPTNLEMNIYVPDKVAAKPAIILAVCSHRVAVIDYQTDIFVAPLVWWHW